MSRWSKGKLLDLSLYLVAGPSFSPNGEFLETVEQSILGGVTCLQFREKEGSIRDFLTSCYALRELADKYGIPFIVNDRVDLALAVDADGVHLGQNDLPISAARRLLGPDKIIGISAHTVEEAQEAERLGADYLGVGPMSHTQTKLDTEPVLGPEGLKPIHLAVGLPIVAIGGITIEKVPSIIQAGASGVAVVSAILSAHDPKAAASALVHSVHENRGR